MKFAEVLIVGLVMLVTPHSLFSIGSHRPLDYLYNLIKSHPFISAAAMVVVANEEPLSCLREIISYCVEEHPIASIVLIGIILSTTMQDLSRIQLIGSWLVKITTRLLYLLISIADYT